MRPQKTEKAHHALRDRPAAISVLERRVLILSDGRRDLDEVAGLLGAQARDAVARLLHEGYLTALAEPAIAAAPVPTTQVESAPASSRRSIAAAKMYVIDMLQLQRGSDASAIAATLRASRDPEELAAQVLGALDHIHAVANRSYSRRVAERLAEILPEQYLPELDVFRDALFGELGAA